jgi:hypothetical protein
VLQDAEPCGIAVGHPYCVACYDELCCRGRFGARQRAKGLGCLHNRIAVPGRERRRKRLAVRGNCELAVERFETARGAEQEWRRIATAPLDEGKARAQAFRPGALELVELACPGKRQKLERIIRGAGREFRLGRRERAIYPEIGRRRRFARVPTRPSAR